MSQRLRNLWGSYWPLSFLPLLLLGLLALSGGARPEHVAVAGVATLLAWGNKHSKSFLLAALPALIVVIGYDCLRFVEPYILAHRKIYACEVRDLDAALFGAATGFAPADLVTAWNRPWLDILFAIPYAAFWMAAIVWAIFLFLTDRFLLRRFLWSLAFVFLCAFAIWCLFPVAPPWYVHMLGCAIDIHAPPNPAGLLRVDAALGIDYFGSFYARSPVVFGAMPSLHVAFPAIAAVTGWRQFPLWGRLAAVFATLWMIAASVYLDHHWVVDGAAAVALAFIANAVLSLVWPAYRATAPRHSGS